ncbi:6-hydroxynicotinate 3-monooxygenase [Apiospora aurea]|uniref:6-hydroxynicotinate 3-monooxygenase n=1 Tax=Apiospora aurea TaxID=335848 RepID=A0ABR1QUR5_9PEZI
MPDSSQLRIAIIGAGIAGLAAAIALKDEPGVDVQIYEKTSELREVGAMIALGPNGMRTLERLGVTDALDESVAFRNESGHPMIYRHYKTDEVVSLDTHSQPIGQRHHTARFFRPHLQQTLARHLGPSSIQLGKAFQSCSFDEELQKLVVTFADGSSELADILLGADGVHSPVRQFFVPTSKTRITGWTTFRSVFPISHVEHIPDLPREAVHIWGPDRALFVTPLAQGLFSIVGSHQEDLDAPRAEARHQAAAWDSAGGVDDLRKFYKSWSPLVRSIVDATPYTKVYPNSAADGLESWVLGGGRGTLAGDAAHAHGGAFAAGGSLAADRLRRLGAQAIREDAEPHTDRVQQTVQGRNEAMVRRIGKVESDEELRSRISNRPDLRWIREHDVVHAFSEARSASSTGQTGPSGQLSSL